MYYCKTADTELEMFDNLNDIRVYVNSLVLDDGITDIEVSDDEGRIYEIELELQRRN